MQTIYDLLGERTLELVLPGEEEQLMPGVAWGPAGALFTPAYWKAQLWYANNRSAYAYLDYATGRSLHEEVSACLLGGHGIPAEMAQAAFYALRERGLVSPLPQPRSGSEIESALRTPMRSTAGRNVSYRFPRRRAGFLASALERLDNEAPPLSAADFRNWLKSFKGIGWKTASWITRNWMHSNEVAVIDIHVFRAGVISGVFRGAESTISSRYRALEDAFLHFAHHLGEEPRRLDVLIWRTMKDASQLALEIFRHSHKQLASTC